MDKERQREIAAMGGREAHARGTAHEFDSEEAREAGRRGGLNSSGGNRGGANNSSREGRSGGER
jgi:general stress protein YciG